MARKGVEAEKGSLGSQGCGENKYQEREEEEKEGLYGTRPLQFDGKCQAGLRTAVAEALSQIGPLRLQDSGRDVASAYQNRGNRMLMRGSLNDPQT